MLAPWHGLLGHRNHRLHNSLATTRMHQSLDTMLSPHPYHSSALATGWYTPQGHPIPRSGDALIWSRHPSSGPISHVIPSWDCNHARLSVGSVSPPSAPGGVLLCSSSSPLGSAPSPHSPSPPTPSTSPTWDSPSSTISRFSSDCHLLHGCLIPARRSPHFSFF
jgi:hypothetical protein